MDINDFDFDLPEGLIATRPISPRGNARLLVSRGSHIQDHHVSDLLEQFQAGDRLVLNDTKVIPARLQGQRTRITGQGPATAKIDITLLDPQGADTWHAFIKPLRKLKEGDVIEIKGGFSAKCVAKSQLDAVLQFSCFGADLDAALEQYGDMPLPPYIAAKRAVDAQDRQDYQTIWAKNRGAVASPTASLHIDRDMLGQLQQKGVQITYVTLHVGAGTFLPVKVQDVTTHKMHAEWGEVTAQAAAEINATKAEGGRVIPVGTTALRLIETAATDGRMMPWSGDTDIFIYPGYKFQITDALMTNFHLPKSTLLMLVAALIGKEQVDAIYRHAIAQEYRFFSYGDASLLIP